MIPLSLAHEIDKTDRQMDRHAEGKGLGQTETGGQIGRQAERERERERD